MAPSVQRANTIFDRDYIQNLKHRDPETEKHFSYYFSTYLEGKLRSRLRSKDALEDIRQETLLRVLEAIYTKGEPREPERFGAFVNSVCNHVLLEYWRRNKSFETPEDVEQVDGQLDPEKAFEQAEVVLQVRKVLSKLHRRERDLLRMLYWDECDRKDISRITEFTLEHVRVMIFRAKRTLKRYLAASPSPRISQRRSFASN